MKLNSPCRPARLRTFGLVCLAALGLWTLPASAQNSPVGPVWDLVEGATRDGVALMQFLDNGTNRTIWMDEIIVPRVPNGSKATRNPGGNGDSTRGGFIADTNAVPPHTNLFGSISFPSSNFVVVVTNYLPIVTTNDAIAIGTLVTNLTDPIPNTISFNFGRPPGEWNFDSEGRVIGYFTEISAAFNVLTNTFLSTNPPVVSGPFMNISITNQIDVEAGVTNYFTNVFSFFVTNAMYLTNVDAIRLTNAISFTAKVVPGKRLTMVCSTPSGQATFRGLPATPLSDIGGQWYGIKKNQSLSFTEFFTLRFPDLLNRYDVTGSGPGYDYEGLTIVSRQKRFGITVALFPTGQQRSDHPPIRGVTGPINVGRRTVTSRGGIQGNNDAADIRLSFDAKHIKN